MVQTSGDAPDRDPEDDSDGKERPRSPTQQARDPIREHEDTHLTTQHGVRIPHTDDSLKVGPRGPTLMEDFHFREKMMHFDHERIPERVVHARGSAAHGYFQVYKPLTHLTKAKVFQDPAKKTPVFVRFSTVVGFRGSADTVRDVRGFATKFYTEEGNWDMVGNNMPVFFIQDAIKFPDLVHSIKPEPHDEVPQASAAHDNFWDFVSLMPESAHMIMWVLSDRALPRSYAMMEGFGVHTFRLIDDAGNARFVKFHWRPVLGTESLVWDETQTIAGKDPDFNRRDLWDRIEKDRPVEFELGVQVVPAEDEDRFDFDLLDPTKVIPEDDVPVEIVGRMVLDRNPDNFFAETEQVAFHPGRVVPGIDVTDDPLLQGRLFSYLDTQLNRFSSANFDELPINRPLAPVHNNQRDGFMRHDIDRHPTNYSPNTVAGGCPMTASAANGGYVHHPAHVEGQKVRARGAKFGDHFTQATMFWNGLTSDEQDRLVEAAHFELGKLKSKDLRHRLVHEFFNRIHHDLAVQIAGGVGVEPPASFAGTPTNRSLPEVSVQRRRRTDTVRGRKVAFLLADGFDAGQVQRMRAMLEEEGAEVEIVAAAGGMLTSAQGAEVEVDKSHPTTASVLYDAVYVPGGGKNIEAQRKTGSAVHFIQQAFKHAKPIGAQDEAVSLLRDAMLPDVAWSTGPTVTDKGVVTSRDGNDFEERFLAAMMQGRHFDRSMATLVPA